MPRAPLFVLALFGAGCLAPAAPAPDPAAVAPDWRVGDWWTFRFTSSVYAAGFDATLVVGQASATGFLVGMPVDAYEVGAVLFHMPPVGRLSRDLAYNVHDVLYSPLRFPLAEGATWETQWAATKLKMTAVREGAVWRVTNDVGGSDRRFDIVYDPAVGWFRSHERAFADGRVLERVELVDAGHDFRGEVRLIDGVRVVLLESRSAGVLRAGAPAAPVVSFSLPVDADTLMVACVFGGAAGEYRAAVLAPDGGTACENAGIVPPGETRVFPRAHEVAAQPGIWEARLAALGQGSATAEVLGYRSWSTSLS